MAKTSNSKLGYMLDHGGAIPIVQDRITRRGLIGGLALILQPMLSTLAKSKPGNLGQGCSNRAELASAANTAAHLDNSFLALPLHNGKFVFKDDGAGNVDLVTILAAFDPAVRDIQTMFVPRETDNTGASGAYIRIYEGAADVRWCGFGGSPELNVLAANAALQSSRQITFPFGDYNVAGTIRPVFDGSKIVSPSGSILRQTHMNRPTFETDSLNDITYENIGIEGYGSGDIAATVNHQADTGNAQAYGIHFSNGNGFTCRNVRVRGCKNVGLRSRYSSNIRLQDCIVEGTHPDDDIAVGDTSHQQFGIEIYARGINAEGSAAADILTRTANLHANKNVRITNCSVGNTAIATYISPGYSDVVIDGYATFGTLAQHSLYVQPFGRIIITNCNLVAEQQVGLKISNNQLVEADELICDNINIANFYAPGISFENYDADPQGVSDNVRARYAFKDPLLTNIHFRNGFDFCIVAGPMTGGSARNCSVRDITLASGRSLIEYRGSSMRIESWQVTNCNRSFIGGAPNLDEKLVIQDIEIDGVAQEPGTTPLSLRPASIPYDFQTDKYYFNNRLVYRLGRIYRVIGSGMSNSTVPMGPADAISGEISLRYEGDFADMRTRVEVNGLTITDRLGVMQATKAISFNDPKFEHTIKNISVPQQIEEVNIQGLMREWGNHNLRNTSFNAVTYDSQSRGRLGRDLVGIGIPVVGNYERGDTIRAINLVSGQPSSWICVARGNPGTWQVLETIH